MSFRVTSASCFALANVVNAQPLTKMKKRAIVVLVFALALGFTTLVKEVDLWGYLRQEQVI